MLKLFEKELEPALTEVNLLQDCMGLQGEIFREVESRRTLKFYVGDRAYFLKLHLGAGWKEIIKNLLQLRLPVLGARNELLAIRKVEVLGVRTLTAVAYAAEGNNPATIHSCLITRSLENTRSLEELAKDGQISTPLRRRLVTQIANTSRTLHTGGVNHRDFYICHFLMDMDTFNHDSPLLYLIDLHRAQIRANTPQRWRVKDVSGLLFSAIDFGLTRNDIYRFVKIYSGKSLRQTLREDSDFWSQVLSRAESLYRKDHGMDNQRLTELSITTRA
ncbi:MAG: lipopolysaccharide core heptose(I) kinase RfaP [Pseudomonadales bacterium]|nr:lipopolysaccharide core heptose(I) kinase RfaP [Pseudomonadales bacterium]MDG1442467.1 lipopolysaccharide core heptose(I) kinase RfaP [Pseudomonadales bacterium]